MWLLFGGRPELCIAEYLVSTESNVGFGSIEVHGMVQFFHPVCCVKRFSSQKDECIGHVATSVESS